MTDMRSDIPEAYGHLEAESLKQFSSRNVDLETQTMKPAIVEDPEEESKSDRAIRPEGNQYATIADNLPMSATEIDPNPPVKSQEEDTLIANPEDGKITEDVSQVPLALQAQLQENLRNDNKTELQQQQEAEQPPE